MTSWKARRNLECAPPLKVVKEKPKSGQARLEETVGGSAASHSGAIGGCKNHQ